MNAVGLIEVSGFASAVEAVDGMLKTAQVEFLTWEKKLGGRLITIFIRGSVSSVEEAIAQGIVRANRVGKTVAHAVIPNPHEEIMKMIAVSAAKLTAGKRGQINEF